jgi:hypothetical protein
MSPPVGATPLPMQIRYLIVPGTPRPKSQLKGLLRLVGLDVRGLNSMNVTLCWIYPLESHIHRFAGPGGMEARRRIFSGRRAEK